MTETDLWLMTAVTFIPTLFGLFLLFIPSNAKDVLRWVSLLGTAATFVASLVVFVGYLDMLDSSSPTRDEAGVMRWHSKTASLEYRADAAVAGSVVRERPDGRAGGMLPKPADDYVARTNWIPRFNIEYFLGIDGISMP